MNDLKIINPFTDITPASISEGERQIEDVVSRVRDVENLRTLSAGEGSASFHFDRQGIWLGNKAFSEAPFKVSIDGDINIENGYYIVTDSAGDARVLIGVYDGDAEIGATAFTGLRISDVGYDVRTDHISHMLLDTSKAGDWDEYDPAEFTPTTTDNLIDVNFDLTEKVQVGDKVRISQNSVDIYGYVVAISTTQLTIYNGSTGSDIADLITVTDSYAIDTIAFSRSIKPSGHPLILQFPIVMSATDSMTITPPAADDLVYFYMQGNIVTLFGVIPDIDLGGAASYGLLLDLPIAYNANYVGSIYRNTGLDNSTMVPVNSDFGVSGKLSFYLDNGVNWTTGTDVATVALNVSYPA